MDLCPTSSFPMASGQPLAIILHPSKPPDQTGYPRTSTGRYVPSNRNSNPFITADCTYLAWRLFGAFAFVCCASSAAIHSDSGTIRRKKPILRRHLLGTAVRGERQCQVTGHHLCRESRPQPLSSL